MQELIPLLGGACVGLIVQQLRIPRWLKIVVFITLCLVVGACASWINGELAMSWSFITFDTVLVWLGGLLAVSLIAVWQRYAMQRS